ncbi:hypothetical protein BKA80DRAFT_107151 [Phyllosticta citrichinensis]
MRGCERRGEERRGEGGNAGPQACPKQRVTTPQTLKGHPNPLLCSALPPTHPTIPSQPFHSILFRPSVPCQKEHEPLSCPRLNKRKPILHACVCFCLVDGRRAMVICTTHSLQTLALCPDLSPRPSHAALFMLFVLPSWVPFQPLSQSSAEPQSCLGLSPQPSALSPQPSVLSPQPRRAGRCKQATELL